MTKSPISSPNCPNAPDMGDFFGNVSISDHHLSSHYFSQERESLIDTGDTSHSKQDKITPEAYKDSRPIEEIRRDARRYADILDGIGNYRWMGKLVACVQSYPETIRHVALIDTIFHSSFPDWCGKPRSPGAWFCKAATFFHAGGEVPQEVKCWAETGFSYRQIDDALRQGQRIPPEISLLVNTQCAPAETDTWIENCHDESIISFSEEVTQGSLHTSQPSVRLGRGMNKVQADTLCRRVQREGRDDGIRADVYPGSGDSFIVRTWWDGVEEIHVKERDWEQYFSQVKAYLCGTI